ncbi:MAG: ChaN family lipoprotein [Elusimicrobiota bacterium]|jgi:hypothetical protein
MGSLKWTRVLLLAACTAIQGRAYSQAAGCSLRSLNELLGCMQAQKQDDFAYSRLFEDGFDVLVFGETHFCNAHREELTANMAEFRRTGITHLALEAYPVSKQDRLSAYKLGMAGLREELKEIQHSTLAADPESYAQLMDAAVENGISLVGIDIDYKGIDLSGPDRKKIEALHQASREELWTRTLAELLKQEPEAKVLLLVGQWHISPENDNEPVRLQTRLSKAGLRTRAISLEGGEMFIDSIVTECARALGLGSRRFLLPTDTRDPSVGGDYHLHLPQDTRHILLRRDPPPVR